MAEFQVYLGWARIVTTDPSGLAAVRELGRALDLAEVWDNRQGRLYLESPAQGQAIVVQSEAPATAGVAEALRSALAGAGATVFESMPDWSRERGGGPTLALLLAESPDSEIAARFAGLLNRRSRQLARELLEAMGGLTPVPLRGPEPNHPGDPPMPVARVPAARVLIPTAILSAPEQLAILLDALVRGILRFLCPADLDQLLLRWVHLHPPEDPHLAPSPLIAGAGEPMPPVVVDPPAEPLPPEPPPAEPLPPEPPPVEPLPPEPPPAKPMLTAAGGRPANPSPVIQGMVIVTPAKSGVIRRRPASAPPGGALCHPFRRPGPPTRPAAGSTPVPPAGPPPPPPPPEPPEPAPPEPAALPSPPPPPEPAPPEPAGPPPPEPPEPAPPKPAAPPPPEPPEPAPPKPAAPPPPPPLPPLAGGEGSPAQGPPRRRRPYRHWVSSSG